MSDNKLILKFKGDNFSNFLLKLKDLTSIGDSINVKIDKENIFIYSTLGDKFILAFKSFILNLDEYFENSIDIDFRLDLIIHNSSKFVKNLEFLTNEDNLKLKLIYHNDRDEEGVMAVRNFQVIGSKLKINWLSGEKNSSISNITKSIIKDKLDIKNKKWGIEISNSQFKDIKKLSNINSKNIIDFEILNNKVFVSETGSWELEIGNTPLENNKFSMNKKFLKSIDDSLDFINFHLFENFILVSDVSSKLMLSYEQDFSDDI